MTNPEIVVCGGGGFIGGHLIADLRRQGVTNLRAVDSKPFSGWYQRFDDVENLVLDLQTKEACEQAVQGGRQVYNLASDMGGMGFIENNKCLCMLSVLINTHLLMAVAQVQTWRSYFLFLLGVRVRRRQAGRTRTSRRSRRADAYPAMPEDGYGWEKALRRTPVPPLHRGFRPDHLRGPLPQRLRPLRHLRRRTREGPGSGLPQGHLRRDERPARDRNLGRRPANALASCTSTIA